MKRPMLHVCGSTVVLDVACMNWHHVSCRWAVPLIKDRGSEAIGFDWHVTGSLVLEPLRMEEPPDGVALGGFEEQDPRHKGEHGRGLVRSPRCDTTDRPVDVPGLCIGEGREEEGSLERRLSGVTSQARGPLGSAGRRSLTAALSAQRPVSPTACLLSRQLLIWICVPRERQLDIGGSLGDLRVSGRFDGIRN